MHYYTDVLTKDYFNFKGRATRTQYWMFMLINFIIMIATLIIIEVLHSIFMYLLLLLYYFFLLIPSFSLSVRRLHDIGQSGWMLLIGFIPIVGTIVIFVLSCVDSQSFSNKYGPNLKEDVSRNTPLTMTRASEYTEETIKKRKFCVYCGKESTAGIYCVDCGRKS